MYAIEGLCVGQTTALGAALQQSLRNLITASRRSTGKTMAISPLVRDTIADDNDYVTLRD
jgi:hypothetical protein